jgi:hypothetical protein
MPRSEGALRLPENVAATLADGLPGDSLDLELAFQRDIAASRHGGMIIDCSSLTTV